MIAVFMGPTATWDEKGLENLAKAIKAGAPDLPAAAKEVARGLADNSSNVRTRAAMVLGSLGEKSVLPQLKEAAGKFVLGTPERQAIDAAIRELGGEVK
jgi:HEAT repeat protein